MPLGMEVGLGPGHTVLDGEPALHNGTGHRSPQLSTFMDADFHCVDINRGPRLLWPNSWMNEDAI